MLHYAHFLYIDPGSGSLLFQMLLSGLLTVIVFFKRLVSFTKAFFSRKKSANSFPDEQSND